MTILDEINFLDEERNYIIIDKLIHLEKITPNPASSVTAYFRERDIQ